MAQVLAQGGYGPLEKREMELLVIMESLG